MLWDAALVDATPRLALVLAASFLDANVWPHAFAIARGEGLEGALVAPDGHEVFRSTQGERAAARQDTLMAAGTLQDAEVLWRLEVWPRDPATLYADVNRRQWSYLAMLVMVVALLLFGTYLTARTVRKELEFARLKGDFVSTVSHEFRSPLTGIRQLGELLMRGRVPTDERRQQYYELITRESDRLTRLVDNLLDFGRLEEGRRQFQFEPFDPRPWLRTLVADFGLELPPGHGPVVAEIPDTLPLIVADREALSSAVYNLLDNAVKYSPADSPIRVAAEGRNGHLVIRVCDQGVGIADADRTHVFEKFHRGSGEIARRVKGAGLGLSLVHHIVTAHGGQVDFDSRPDQGTTFSIELKAAPPTPYASHPRR
ncbi:MAG: sensor histidine kinase [Acidobacteriota bacterium]